MNKRIILISLLVLSSIYGFTQSTTLKRNSVFIEFGGPGILGSINYDGVISYKNNVGVSIGFGISPSFPGLYRSIPVRLNIFKQIKNHSIEWGIAVARLSLKGEKERIVVTSGRFGYKYTSLDHKRYFGIAFTPMIGVGRNLTFVPWGALKFGFAF